MDNLRKVVALALHEVRSLAANPSMAATIFVLLFFALLFTDFFLLRMVFSAISLSACRVQHWRNWDRMHLGRRT